MNLPFTDIQLKFYNIISCKGFEISDSIGLSFGACAQAKLGIILIFFLNAILRKWGGEEIGVDYSFIGGLVGGLVSYFLSISTTGSFKISFIIGLTIMAMGGYLGGGLFVYEE